MNRAQLNSAEKSQVATSYNSKGQAVDPHTRQPLKSGKIDLGHRHGYEEKAMQRCAERCHMTQKQYNQMIKQNANRLFYWEDRRQNRSHKHECKDARKQNHKCMKIIREFLNKNNGKNKQPSKERNSKSSPKSRVSKGMKIQGYSRTSFGGKLTSSGKGKGGFISGRSGGRTGASPSGIGGKGGSSTGGKGGTSTGGGGGKGGASASGGGKGK